jgi:hypothetical protein
MRRPARAALSKQNLAAPTACCVAERVLAEAVFPDSAPVKPMKGLLG